MNVFYNSLLAVLFLLSLSFTSQAQWPNVVINELNADNPGTGGGPGGGDTAEFLELHGEPNTALDSLVLVFFNGNDAGASYAAYDLDGFTLDNYGFFTIGSNLVPGVDYIFPNATNNIQNGADGIGLYWANDTDFPIGSFPVTENLIDALVYGTNDAQDDVMIGLLGLDLAVPGYVQQDETAQTAGVDLTLSRMPDGGEVFAVNYAVQELTPDTYNQPPCVVSELLFADGSAQLTFCDNVAALVEWSAFAGTGNYVTIISDSDGLIYATTQNSGYDFTGMIGLWTIRHVAYTQNIMNNSDEIGAPWNEIIADECIEISPPIQIDVVMCSGCVAGEVLADLGTNAVIISDENADVLSLSNTSTSQTASYAYVLTTDDGAVIQEVDETFDFNTLSSGWYAIYGVSYTDGLTLPNPGSLITTANANVCIAITASPLSLHVVTIPTVVINELNADNPGGGGPGGGQDLTEFIELFGEPNASLDGLSLVFYNGNGAVSYAAYDLDGYFLNDFGFFVLGNPGMTAADMFFDLASNTIQNGADAVALVIGDASDYPNETPINGLNLVDALVYGTDDAQDDALIAGLGLDVLVPGYTQQNETAQGGGGADLTISRIPDGGLPFSTTYVAQALTTGTWNLPPCSVESVMLADSTMSIQICDGEAAQWSMGTFQGTGQFIFVLTDSNDTIVSTSTDGNWVWMGAIGQYRVYAVAYTGTLDTETIAPGYALASVMASECVAITNSYVSVNIVPCSGCVGGQITLSGLPNATVILDGNPVYFTLGNTSTSLTDSYTYILLDENDIFITWITSSFDFATLAQGVYHVVGLSYQGSVTGAAVGDPYTNIVSTDCVDFSANVAIVSVVVIQPVVINELNADNPGGPDDAEFVELYGDPNAGLDHLVIVCFDGTDLLSYAAFDLDGYVLDENGFFVLGNAGAANVDYIIGNATIQNGSDALVVYAGNATDFPNGSALSSLNMIDGLVYATGDPEVNGLITGLGLDIMFPGYTQFDETAQQNGFDLTISRVPDGGTAFDLSGFVLQPLTPGTFNIVASGCINQQACNFDPLAMMDDGTCILPGDPCDDGNAETVADAYNTNCDCLGLAPLEGCNDAFACNFNPLATTNDGSCLYVTDPCDDGNPLTLADVYDSACNCTGVIGVEEYTALSGINIYPNPVQESLFVSADGLIPGVYTCVLVDAMGRCIHEEKKHVVGHLLFELDMSSCPTGLYTIKWIGATGQLEQRIMKY